MYNIMLFFKRQHRVIHYIKHGFLLKTAGDSKSNSCCFDDYITGGLETFYFSSIADKFAIYCEKPA